jgi:hypothetical protein
VATIAPGKHRRRAPEMEAPAGMPFSSAGLLQAPVDVAGPATGDSGAWAPEYDRMPGHRDMAGAAFPAANQRQAPTDPDRRPSGAGPWPQWDASPPPYPDHPSAPVPRVRAPLAPGAGGAGRGPAGSSSPEVPRSLPNSGPPRLPQRMPSGQPNPGAAAREAAENEAAHLRTLILSLSEQLSHMSAYVTQNLESSGGLVTMPAPAVAPAQTPTIAPPRPRTRPGAPPARVPRPRTAPAKPAGLAGPARPRTTPTRKPQARPRQYQAMRIATAATATLFSFAVITAAAEIGMHGFNFFVFRSGGTGETAPTVGTDQQFLAHQAAAAKAVAAHTPGRHSAKHTSG